LVPSSLRRLKEIRFDSELYNMADSIREHLKKKRGDKELAKEATKTACAGWGVLFPAQGSTPDFSTEYKRRRLERP